MIMPIIPIYQIVLIYLFSALSSYDKERKENEFCLVLGSFRGVCLWLCCFVSQCQF